MTQIKPVGVFGALSGQNGPMSTVPDSCVTRVPIFATLDDGAQLEVARFATPRRLAKGEVLYRQGESVAQLFVMHTGSAKLIHLRADGQEQVVRTVGPGGVVGEHAFLTGSRPDHTVVALEALEACVFDHRDLARLTATHPEIAVQLLRRMSHLLAETEERLRAVSATDVTARLADYLVNLPTTVPGQFVVVLPMAKRDVASYLGTTPESLSRAFARLEADHLVEVDGRRIRLLDVSALDEAAAG